MVYLIEADTLMEERKKFHDPPNIRSLVPKLVTTRIMGQTRLAHNKLK